MGDLTTLASVKTYGGITDTTKDALLSALITAASAAVEQYIGRIIQQQSYTALMDGNGAALLPLPQYPISAVSVVEINGVAVGANSTWGDGGFAHDGDRSLYFPGEGRVFPVGKRNVKVTYTAGYASVPADLAQAVNELVLSDMKNRDHIGWQSKSLAGETITLDLRAMPPSAKSVIDAYRDVLPR